MTVTMMDGLPGRRDGDSRRGVEDDDEHSIINSAWLHL